MKQGFKRIVSMALIASMIATMAPSTAWAASVDNTDAAQVEAQTAADEEVAPVAESAAETEAVEVQTETEPAATEETEAQTETEETEISEENAEASEEITEDTEKESRLTVIAAGSLIDEQIIDTFTELENTQLFMNIMAVNFENVKNVSIEAKSLSVEYNAVQHAGLFGTLMIFGIPAVILISGFVVWYRRRKA